MPRITKDHDSRRSEILDAAQQLFYQKGYEQTSIQDLLNAIGIAKGTFYHYFDSKQALLAELTDRVVVDGMTIVEALVNDPKLTAVEKFRQIYGQMHQWKLARKDFVLDLMHMFYRDENLRLRYELMRAATIQVVPLLAVVVEQGVAEGVFVTAYPHAVAEITYRLLQNLSEIIADLLLHPRPDVAALLIENVNAYQEATERILGAPQGSLPIFDAAMIYEKWFAAA
ncbi:MAG: TetR/AcrR family transcriptional regulator [Caldilineaceae bacterium]